ncbi:uncharacterized protein LOC101280547 [Orcinus orca]|uniref:uncharacterized protein LOC101280547 n=1 Tax=Orcinus orca TaxID=9733 RepID=UPI002111E98E|nr:uncharacterized protein LOC101280547 [Orcinus orca]
MWGLPGPGLKPVSPALAGRFLTTAPPGKSRRMLFVPSYLCYASGRIRKEGRAVLFAIAKRRKQPSVHHEWMEKRNGVHPYKGILFSLRKEERWFSRIWALAAVTPVFSGSPRYVPFTSRNAVSSVAVSGVIKVFNDLKVSKSSSPEDVKKRKKAVLFCLSEDTKNLILEEGEEMLVGDVGQTADDPYAILVKVLPHKDCHYTLCDAACETKESKEEAWAPQSAPLKSKMIYASSKDAVEEKLTGIKHELEANCYEEVKDHCTLAEKLGASVFISLEGKPQTCPQGLQAAPFLPDQRGWGGSQQGAGNPFTQVAKQPPHLLGHPPPSIPEGSGLPKLLFFFFFFFVVRGPLAVMASSVAEHRLRTRRLSGHGSRAQPLRGMWDLPGPGHEPASPASAGGLSTTAPPGKPPNCF